MIGGGKDVDSFLKQLIKNKLSKITTKELKYYSEQYHFSLTDQEIHGIIHYLRTQPIDPFSEQGRKKLVLDLAQITNPNTAKQALDLFHELINVYGVDHLF